MKKEINQKYFEDRSKSVGDAVDAIFKDLRTLEAQEAIIKQKKGELNSELLKLRGEQRFIDLIINQYEENTNEDPAPDKGPQPTPKVPDNTGAKG